MTLTEEILGKIVSREALPGIIQPAITAGKKIVFTNGCFDILHPGHIQVLGAAKNEGDILVVGMNADASVKKLKGEDRPVMDEQSRAILLASLVFVDYVVIFTDETPLELIRELRPNVLVKGGDYRREEIVGADLVEAGGGRTVIVPLLAGHSSSEIIGKKGKDDHHR